MQNFLEKTKMLLLEANVLTATEDIASYLTEWRGLYVGKTPAVLKPGTTAEVSAVMKLASQFKVPIVPQGGNTGLVGGQIPSKKGGEVVLSLTRLNRIRSIDVDSCSMVAEAGVTLASAQRAAEAVNQLFPLSLAAEGTCTIGGNLATNAGGTAVLAYGNARELTLGVEVVLADGRILNCLGSLRKDNTGYDLKNLFVGSEGTLGIITAATLKLFPQPSEKATAFCMVTSPQHALDLLIISKQKAGSAVTACEIMSNVAIEFVLRHGHDVVLPLQGVGAWYVLLEVSGAEGANTATLLEGILEQAFENGTVEDAVIAQSGSQRASIWKLRELLSEVQSHEGGSIKHDVSLPLAKIPEFLDKADAAVAALIPCCRPAAFGHIGDGNIHYNVSQPIGANKEHFLTRWKDMNTVIHDIVYQLGGSFSAEHGIGQLKRDELRKYKDPVAIELMIAIKKALDPAGILNPAKVISPSLISALAAPLE